MKIIYIYLFVLLSTPIHSQKYDIPQIDWDALQTTKPWEATEKWSTPPKIVTPGISNSNAPSDAIILFDGNNLSHWHKPKYGYGVKYEDTKALVKNNVHENFPGTEPEWLIKSGALHVAPGTGDMATKKPFGSVQLHLEWLPPVDIDKEGQQYSNSGVFFMGLYEVQILNSYENSTYPNGQAGAVYKQHIPLVNANRPPGEWQSYDIIFNAPEFDANGQVKKKASVTAFLNGILVQNNVTLQGPTFYIGQPKYFSHPDKLPLILQDHGDKVRYRNIWLREL